MTEITINRRRRYSRSIGSELLVNGKLVCHALELPWRWNQKNISCIPSGVYKCIWRYDRDRVQLENIHCPGGFRTEIQIHTGNKPSDILGCIIVGTTITPNYVHHSKDAMKLLVEAMFPGQYGPGYSMNHTTLRISGILMNNQFDNLDGINPALKHVV
jgi:hypothetical protein